MPKIPHSAVTAGMFPLQFLLLSSRYQLKNGNALVSAILHFPYCRTTWSDTNTIPFL